MPLGESFYEIEFIPKGYFQGQKKCELTEILFHEQEDRLPEIYDGREIAGTLFSRERTFVRSLKRCSSQTVKFKVCGN